MKFIKKLYVRFTLWRTPYVIVSFPKSGRTWLRYFFSRYFHFAFARQESLDFIPKFQTKRGDPLIQFTHVGFDKPHANIEELYSAFQRKTLVLLVRDPRDVVVSYYYQVINRQSNLREITDKNVSQISDFTRDPNLGIQQIINFYNSWYDVLKKRGVVQMIHYESFQRDPEKSFLKLLRLIGINEIDPNAFKSALQNSHFSNMSFKERSGLLKGPRFSNLNANVSERKVRKGKIGGYKDELLKVDIDYLNKKMKLLHPVFGYRVD